MVREIITLHVGQTGVQTADHFWQLMCLEHKIDLDGTKLTRSRFNDLSTLRTCGQIVKTNCDPDTNDFQSMFIENSKHRFCSRSVFIDPDPETIASFITKCDNGLFNVDRYLCSNDSASYSFAKGQAMMRSPFGEHVIDEVRKLLEHSESPEGFLTTCSLAGGTGSGLSAALLNTLQTMNKKKANVQFSVFPSREAAIVEPYNCVLYESKTADFNRAVLLVDNIALQTAIRFMYPPKAGFDQINSLLAQVASNITVTNRFPECNEGKITLADIQFLLNPTKHIKYGAVSYSPISSNYNLTYDNLNEARLTKDCFSSANILIRGKNLGMLPSLGTCMLYRGDLSIFSIKDVITECMKQIPAAVPNGFNVCVNRNRPSCLRKSGIIKSDNSACKLSAHLGLVDVWKITYQNFQKLFSKRAFLHWFEKDGLTFCEVQEAGESVKQLLDEYNLMLGH